MYTRHKGSGLLELELGDFKIESRFRLLAFDQGRFSFADLDYDSGAVTRKTKKKATPGNTAILVTSPKDPRFTAIGEEITRPDQLRVLVFSQETVEEVSVTFDGVDSTRVVLENRNISDLKPGQPSPMFYADWNPRLYTRGLHTLKVTVKLETSGRFVEKSQYFSLDGSHESFPVLASFVLLVEWVPFCQFAFFFVVASLLAFMVIMRLVHYARLR